MPTKLSKFFVDAPCKDYAHPWIDSCVSATAGVALQALPECVKIYSMLYFITLLTKRRVPTLTDLKKTFISLLHSTAFLTWSALSFSMFICILRRVFGNFNVLSVSFIPSFLSSFTAILLERPSRHTMLCLYVSNIATETLFRMAVSRGYISTIPGGEVYIFAAGMTALLYFFRNKTNNTDSIFKIIRIALGPYEEKGYTEKKIPSAAKQPSSCERTNINKRKRHPIFNTVWEALKVYKMIIDKIKTLGGKHLTCPHPNSCVHYVLGGGLKMFSLGFCVQMGLNLVFQMKNLLRKPKQFKEILFKKGTINIALFLGGFTSLYKLVSCSLRRAYNADSPQYAIVAGLIASTSFYMYPSNTIALYVVWKALQLMWNHGVENGNVPEVKWFVIFLYCFSTAVLFHAAIVEPQTLRVSYWKFLYNLSGGRIATMSRIPIDGFGLETSKQLQEVLRISRTTDKLNYHF